MLISKREPCRQSPNALFPNTLKLLAPLPNSSVDWRKKKRSLQHIPTLHVSCATIMGYALGVKMDQAIHSHGAQRLKN
jgi:hypothetical protein